MHLAGGAIARARAPRLGQARRQRSAERAWRRLTARPRWPLQAGCACAPRRRCAAVSGVPLPVPSCQSESLPAWSRAHGRGQHQSASSLTRLCCIAANAECQYKCGGERSAHSIFTNFAQHGPWSPHRRRGVIAHAHLIPRPHRPVSTPGRSGQRMFSNPCLRASLADVSPMHTAIAAVPARSPTRARPMVRRRSHLGHSSKVHLSTGPGRGHGRVRIYAPSSEPATSKATLNHICSERRCRIEHLPIACSAI